MKAYEKQTISAGQLAILYVSFMVGSSIVYIPNPMIQFAGNMSWLSLIASALMSMLLLSLVLYLFRCYPDDIYTAHLERVYGRWIAGVSAVLLMLMLQSHVRLYRARGREFLHQHHDARNPDLHV
jgi:spore germination protein KB